MTLESPFQITLVQVLKGATLVGEYFHSLGDPDFWMRARDFPGEVFYSYKSRRVSKAALEKVSCKMKASFYRSCCPTWAEGLVRQMAA